MPLSLSSVTLSCPHFIKNTASYTLAAPLKAFHVFKTALKSVTNCAIQKIQTSYFYASTKGYQQFRDNIKLVSAICTIYGIEIGAIIGGAQTIAVGMVAGGLLGIAGTALATVGFQAMQGIFKSAADIEIDTWAQNEINRNPQNTRNIRLAADKIHHAYQTRQTELDLSGHNLTTLPRIVWQLAQLRTLDLSLNHFGSIPPEIGQLTQLQTLNLRGNSLHVLPNEIATLNNLQTLNLGNRNLRTIAEEFAYGHDHLLDFLLTDEVMPGVCSERGRLKLEIMLKYANDQIIHDDASTWQHSATLNQLFYQASVLSDGNHQDSAIKAQAQTLLARYLGKENIRQFAAQAEDMGISLAEYDGFVFVTQNGTAGLTIHKNGYETNILNAPYANHDAPNARLTNGVLIHHKDQEVDLFRSPDQLQPFALINQAYLTKLNQQGLTTLLTAINMGDEYQRRFSEVLTVKSVGVLASRRGTTQAEKNDVAPYKMVNETASARLFDIFSALAGPTSADPTPAYMGIANRSATITDDHFKNICAAFPGFTEEKQHAALLFVLATIFVRYSSEPMFGTGDDSPAALRLYASALLNKLKQLDENLFNQIHGNRLQNTLFDNACTDLLTSDMRDLAKSNGDINLIYEQVMPEMWK